MKKITKKFIFCAVLAITITAFMQFCRPINKVTNRREVTATVTDKEVKNYSDKSKYLVYTKDEDGNVQVFEITDALLAWQFDSSDIYAGIEIGKTYVFDIGGSRRKLFSWYPNIYGFKEK